MNDSEMARAGWLYGKQSAGGTLTDIERTFLQGLLDRMDKPERAGSIAAIIQIMLGDGKAK